MDFFMHSYCDNLTKQLAQLWAMMSPSDFERLQSSPGVLARVYSDYGAAGRVRDQLVAVVKGDGVLELEHLELLMTNSTSLPAQRAKELAESTPTPDGAKLVWVGIDIILLNSYWSIPTYPERTLLISYVTRAAKSTSLQPGQAVATIRAMYEAENNEGAANEQVQRRLARDVYKVLESFCMTCKARKAPGTKLRSCSGCRFRRYCSKECQRKDWKRHKAECGHDAVVNRIFLEHVQPDDC